MAQGGDPGHGRLTTHVLDTTAGRPGAGILVELFRVDGGDRGERLASVTTNDDGRVDRPLLEGAAMVLGVYELMFHVGDYLSGGATVTEPAFLDRVPIRFGIARADQHYHVPLLISPYAYSTYRGS